jgi:hypothetical protein
VLYNDFLKVPLEQQVKAEEVQQKKNKTKGPDPVASSAFEGVDRQFLNTNDDDDDDRPVSLAKLTLNRLETLRTRALADRLEELHFAYAAKPDGNNLIRIKSHLALYVKTTPPARAFIKPLLLLGIACPDQTVRNECLQQLKQTVSHDEKWEKHLEKLLDTDDTIVSELEDRLESIDLTPFRKPGHPRFQSHVLTQEVLKNPFYVYLLANGEPQTLGWVKSAITKLLNHEDPSVRLRAAYASQVENYSSLPKEAKEQVSEDLSELWKQYAAGRLMVGPDAVGVELADFSEKLLPHLDPAVANWMAFSVFGNNLSDAEKFQVYTAMEEALKKMQSFNNPGFQTVFKAYVKTRNQLLTSKNDELFLDVIQRVVSFSAELAKKNTSGAYLGVGGYPRSETQLTPYLSFLKPYESRLLQLLQDGTRPDTGELLDNEVRILEQVLNVLRQVASPNPG